MSEKKKTETVMGWCRDGIHEKCRKLVHLSDVEDLICTCTCPHIGDHGD